MTIKYMCSADYNTLWNHAKDNNLKIIALVLSNGGYNRNWILCYEPNSTNQSTL